MPAAKRTEVFDIPREKFYNAIIDYESYPELLSEVNAVEVLDFGETSARVRYEVKIIKSFSYILHLFHERPQGISWELESGDLFKVNNGFWKLTEEDDGKTKVEYSLEVGFKVFAPKAITQKLVAHNLPKMMDIFYQRAVKGI